MYKKDYIVKAIKAQCYLKRGWLLSIFGILEPNTGSHLKLEEEINKYHEDIGIKTIHGKMYVNIDNKEELIEDYIPNKPLFDVNEKIDLKVGDLKSLKTNITTTYGILITNLLLVEYPYEGLVEYINGEFTPKTTNAFAAKALRTNIATMDMHLKFENAISMINCLAPICVPSATERSFTPNQALLQKKRELVELHKDNLNDPAIIADIQNQIRLLDAEYLKGDPASRFFITEKGKSSRIRTGGIFGGEQDFVDESKFSVMVNSLSEGWKIENLPMMANSIRGASFNRGANTALGGNEVKISARVFQNYKIDTDDCHTTRYVNKLINKENYQNFVGRYLIGNDKALTKEQLHDLIGKDIKLRSPMRCIAPGTSFCKKCFGDVISNGGIGLTGMVTQFLSTFLTLFLKLMHVSSISVARYNYLERIH